ncbi:MAG TPA: dATP/dGTP diphosphohydrolase domain-containing protein [Candidatus Paceibacterota bacterium]
MTEEEFWGNQFTSANTSKEYTTDAPEKIGTGAIKYDGGKPCVWRGVINYFPRALWGVAEISTFGANKYAWAGWENLEDGYARYQDARFRHSLKHAMGEEDDPDSKLLHLKHDAWGALAALELYMQEKEREAKGMDRKNDLYA